MAKMRLDQLLVELGFFQSRSRARDAVERGTVSSAGKVLSKPGLMVEEGLKLQIDDPARAYVSRAALKLIAGLDGFNLDVKGRSALDIGVSTGGFTQVLLERGVRHVVAVDVGHGQLDKALAMNPAITHYEGLNARDLSQTHLGDHKIDLVVSDVSFISLKLALPPALGLAEKGALALLLVKPQFEAGREAIGKGGLLKSAARGWEVALSLQEWLNSFPGWRAHGLLPSPIEGGEGNQEYLLFGEKQ